MSRLTDFYEAKKVPFEDQILSEKNLLIVVPEKKHDVGALLAEIGITPFEVSVTWPKKSIILDEEIDALEPKLVVQLDCKLTEKAISLESGVPDPIRNDIREAVPEITADTFVGLHHHDEFSIKDGLGVVGYFDARQKRWTGLIGLLKAQRRSFCSITNHGSIGGWVKQYNACKKAGVKAIFGMEAYISNYRGDDPEQKKAHRSANHLVLIANTEEGFYNIIKIHNDAQLNGFYYTPRVNREALERWGKGIIASSACMAGEISRFLMEDKQAEAKETWEFYNRIFDAFYVEIQIIESEDQREANRRLIQFAQSVGAPLVLTCDSHYLDPEYSETHDILMLLRQKKTIMDKMEKDDVWSFDVKNLYHRDAAGMRNVFEQGFMNDQGEHAPFKDDIFTEEVFTEAMANTLKIARGTAVITLDSKIKLPKLYDNGKEVLRKKVNEGFAARGLIHKENRDESLKRIKHEFETITRMGWGDYFLVMDKIIADTKAKFGEWAIGYGRGSAAGSLVSYCLGLTDVDPMEYGLLFERFLEEGRPDPPDIDTDFDPRYRDWVKKHIVEVFGTKKVCSIGTYATYKTRAVIIDVARALGENLAEVMAVTKRIEPLRAFEDEAGEEHKVDQMPFDDICEHYPELQAYFDAHPAVRRHSEILRNQVKNMGTHAGGVIISDLDLPDRIPVCKDKNGLVISTWGESGSLQELSAVGLVKFDILGLNNLPVISDCIKMIEKTTGHHIARADIPISDREAIYLGSKRDLVGIFQFENPVTKPIADAVGMESLEDVAAITSLIRPGPMDADIDGVRMPLEYARRKQGGDFESPDFIRKALASTYSLIVYQEDVMRISRVLSGFTAVESNKLRKAAGKKIRELMVSIREKFIAGAKTRVDAGEITQEEVVKIWEQIETFAGYGFNKSVDIETPVWCNDVVSKVGNVRPGDVVRCVVNGQIVKTEVVANHDHGVLPAFEVDFGDGKKVVCSIFHKFETPDGKVPLWKLLKSGEVWCAEDIGKLGMQILSGEVPNTAISGEASERESGSYPRRDERPGSMSRMRPKVKERIGVSEASPNMSEGDGDFASEQIASGDEEHQDGTGCRRGDDAQREGGQGHSCVCGRQRNATCHSGKKREFGEIKQDGQVSEEGIRDSHCHISAEGHLGGSVCKSPAVEKGSSERVYGKLGTRTEGREELSCGGMALDGNSGEDGCVREASSGSVSRDREGGGLCKSVGVGRSGRMLALREGLRSEALSFLENSREGHSPESRGGEPQDNSHSAGIGVLEREREVQTKARMGEHVPSNSGQQDSGRVSARRVLSARFVGFRRMCDLEVRHESHNYILANGIASCNSHAVTYGAITTVELWLKHNFPIQYIAALVNNTKLGKMKHGSNNILVDYLNYARRLEIPVMGPDINMSGTDFRVEGDGIRFALKTIKNISKAAALIEHFQPFTSMEDFYERVRIEDGKIPDDAKEPEAEEEAGEEAAEQPAEEQPVDEADEPQLTPEDNADREKMIAEEIAKMANPDVKSSAKRPNRKVVESLIAAGAFDRFGTRNEMAMAYWRLRKKATKREKLAEKVQAANQKHDDAKVAFVTASTSGDAKAIKKTGTAVAKTEVALQKAKLALEEEEKIEAAIAAIPREARPKKNQDDMPPDDLPLEKWQELESEVLGMCLSRPILYKEYEVQIRKENWYLISEIDPDRKKVQVFGKIMNVAQHISKAGNSMHIVYLNDGIDTLKFFVFQGGWEYFRDHYKVGTIGVVPLARFDDGDGSTRFFDDRGHCTILQKG
jgi:DNA-directed DNA polymerase III PolC